MTIPNHRDGAIEIRTCRTASPRDRWPVQSFSAIDQHDADGVADHATD